MWNRAWSDVKTGADITYHASGASDVVGCVSNPTLGGCTKAAILTAGFVLTGGEDELEIAAYEGAEDLADKEAADLADDAVTCLAPHSFTGSTKVLLAAGVMVPIEDIKTGDTVMATDPQTGQTAPHTVQRVIKTTTDHDFTDLTIKAAGKATGHTTHNKRAAAPAVLTTTWHHPFWDATTHQWVDASHLTPGTHLREANGTQATVTHIRNYHTAQTTYDLTITDLHTYYVLAGATPVLVHNCDTTITARQVSLIREGPYADESVPATGADVTSEQSEAMQGLPCHSCGESPEGVTMVGDHQPATGLDPEASQNLFPQCPACSGDQSRAVLRAQKLMRDHFNMPEPKVPGYYAKLLSILDSHTSG